MNLRRRVTSRRPERSEGEGPEAGILSFASLRTTALSRITRARRRSRGHQDHPRHVPGKRRRAQQLERLRVVAVDGRTGDADVELAAVGRDGEAHARAAAELDAAIHAPAFEIVGPELVVAGL